MTDFRRTASTLALVATLSLAVSACGWFRGDDEAAMTSEASTATTTTTTRQPTAVGEMRPVPQQQPMREQEYQSTLQK